MKESDEGVLAVEGVFSKDDLLIGKIFKYGLQKFVILRN